MDKQNNSNLDALLNNLIENFGEDDPVTQKVESLMEENVNLLLVGATGSGKSSTINAMFNMQVAKVGVGVDQGAFDGGEEQTRENADDRDDDEQFDERERRERGFGLRVFHDVTLSSC